MASSVMTSAAVALPSLLVKSSVSSRKISTPSVVGLQNSSFLGHPSEKNALFLSQSARGSNTSTSAVRSNGLKIEARTAGQVKEIEVEIEKPLGLSFGPRVGGGVLVTGVVPGSNGAKAGVKTGDQVLYTTSFFGDELWPSDNVQFTQSAIRARPDSVYFVFARGGTVDVKRLPKRAVPSRFGRKLTEAQKARATHICLDCGFIYFLPKSFDEQPDEFECPQCSAPKKRFAKYDPETGRAIGGGTPVVVLASIVAGVVAIGAAVFYGLQ